MALKRPESPQTATKVPKKVPKVVRLIFPTVPPCWKRVADFDHPEFVFTYVAQRTHTVRGDDGTIVEDAMAANVSGGLVTGSIPVAPTSKIRYLWDLRISWSPVTTRQGCTRAFGGAGRA
jgi:hypothetical protein